ncbi:MAG: hypothetical protein WCE35_23700 [Bradyrhizobium sp.]
MILDEFRFRCARTFVLEQLIVVHCGSADLRWALAALALRSFMAMLAVVQARLMSLIQDTARRRRKAGFAGDIAHADTTVAAARG